MNADMILTIINGVLAIVQNHQSANPGAPPLTAEQVHAQFMADIDSGESDIAKEFAAKGWDLPS